MPGVRRGTNSYHKIPRWEPGDNTLAYRPLKENLNDIVGSYSMTNSGITFSDGVAVLDGSQRATIPSLSLNGTRTINFWFKKTNDYNGMIFSKGDTSGYAQLRTNGFSAGGSGGGSFNQDITSGGATPSNVWRNCVITQTTTGGLKFYLDGSYYGTTSGTHYFDWSMSCFGWSGNTSYPYALIGEVSEMILEDKERTAGEISRYYNQTKDNYKQEWSRQPGADTMLYLPFDNNLEDKSGNSVSITGSGIGYETIGGGNYVKVTDTSGSITGDGTLMAPIGTGDFAVSLWVKPITSTENPILFGNRYESSPWPGVFIFMDFKGNYGTADRLVFMVTDDVPSVSCSSLVGSWHHIVLTRISGTCYGYVDGVSAVSWTDTTNLQNDNMIYILNRGNHTNQKRSSTGACLDELIVEKKGWTQEDISNYYNWSKGTYGL